MTNLLAKVVMLGIIAAGFAFTGDLGWLARRGMDVIEAADLAVDQPAAAWPATPSEPVTVEPLPAADPRPARDIPAVATPREPAVIPAAEMKPPVGGPPAVSWASLAAGDRLVLWLGPTPHRCLVLDVVDPATGAAVAYDTVAVSREGQPLASAGPPRRVIVGRPPERVPGMSLERGGLVHVADDGIAASREGRWLGPITAIAVVD